VAFYSIFLRNLRSQLSVATIIACGNYTCRGRPSSSVVRDRIERGTLVTRPVSFSPLILDGF
jgi:hypothetical protein